MSDDLCSICASESITYDEFMEPIISHKLDMRTTRFSTNCCVDSYIDGLTRNPNVDIFELIIQINSKNNFKRICSYIAQTNVLKKILIIFKFPEYLGYFTMFAEFFAKNNSIESLEVRIVCESESKLKVLCISFEEALIYSFRLNNRVQLELNYYIMCDNAYLQTLDSFARLKQKANEIKDLIM